MNCDKTAVALLTFSPPDAKAWLYDLDQPDPTGGIMLCRKHANATVVPMSWQLLDSRDPAWPGPDIAGSDTPSDMPHVVAPPSIPAVAAFEVAVPVTVPELPSDSAAIEEEFAALRTDLPVTPQHYAEPHMATVRAAGGTTPENDLVDLGGAVPPDPSLFELPLSDIPAVTPYPGY